MTSSKHPPKRHDERLWLAGFSWGSFKYVRDACDYLLSQNIPTESPIYYPLVTAIAVLYARPFKRSKGIGSLSTQFVPKKFHHLHEQIIMLRDKTVAHLDPGGAVFGNVPANHVQLTVQGHRFSLGMTQIKFQRETIVQVRELADTLVARMLKYTREVAITYPGGFPPEGEYLIDLTAGEFRPLTSNR